MSVLLTTLSDLESAQAREYLGTGKRLPERVVFFLSVAHVEAALMIQFNAAKAKYPGLDAWEFLACATGEPRDSDFMHLLACFYRLQGQVVIADWVEHDHDEFTRFFAQARETFFKVLCKLSY